MQNRKAIINQFGSANEIQIKNETRLPELQPNELLIKIDASTVSATDIFIRKGIYPLLKGKPPITLGYDFVGVVKALGEKVTKWKVGDRVADVCMTGGNADYIVRSEHGLLKVNEGLPAEQAVCLVMSGMTAYQIFKRFQLKKGQHALIHGGAGAVGATLLQLCALYGIHTVSTCSSEKLDFIRSQNAVAVDYTSPTYFKNLKDNAEQGFDAAFDFTNQQSFNHSFRLLKTGGKLVTSAVYSSGRKITKKTMLNFLGFGFDFGLMMLKLKWWNVLPNGKRASFYGVMDSKRLAPEQYQADFDHLQQLVLDRKMALPIHQVYGLKEVQEAHQQLENGQSTGFIVIKTDTFNLL